MSDRLSRWVLLGGNRYLVGGGILGLMTLVATVPIFTGAVIRNTTPLTYMASALITGNVTLISLVVAINQVVLSQELESPGSLRDEIEATADYRQAALDRETAPTEPADFLQEILEQTGCRVRSLEFPEETDDASDRLVTDLSEHCRTVSESLESASGDLSAVVLPLLGADYAGSIRDAHRIQSSIDAERHEELSENLEELALDLENLDVARQYFTTAFVKEELAELSRSLLYVGILVVSIAIALLFQLTTYSGPSPPTSELFGLAVLTMMFGLTPLALLIAFVLRIATVAGHIASITPFSS
ncbi:hypothetical protein HWV07_15165 [Natronomonas salina]|uniref:hypothetical protein n=1 Tax=Natronomonas salina TaxID=1710540 RepID=UPI0015B6CF47|nr:hypothetical protein [Natronomonas salina]QLD90301.1 hypothetical protein HWV07_15165 [Natronomonas salina]